MPLSNNPDGQDNIFKEQLFLFDSQINLYILNIYVIIFSTQLLSLYLYLFIYLGWCLIHIRCSRKVCWINKSLFFDNWAFEVLKLTKLKLYYLGNNVLLFRSIKYGNLFITLDDLGLNWYGFTGPFYKMHPMAKVLCNLRPWNFASLNVF